MSPLASRILAAEGHGPVAVTALAVANRAINRVSLAAPLQQIQVSDTFTGICFT